MAKIRCPYCNLVVEESEFNQKGKIKIHVEGCLERVLEEEKRAVKAGWLTVGTRGEK